MIRRLLVADRGMFARRIFTTCQAVGIETVAIFTAAEADAPYLTEADFAVRVPAGPGDGTAPGGEGARGEPAFDIAAVLAAAGRCGADAVHPGHGPLAADPQFATSVLAAGLTWIGAAPTVLAAISSKLGMRATLTEAGFCVPGSTVDPDEVTSFPVLVKPSAGRGGVGMRVVRDPQALPAAVASARRDAALAFGDDTVFCERYIDPARHVEVQIIADASGTIVPLGERECSVQRHRQRILEEAPSPAVDPGLRAELFTAATGAIRAIGYVGVATVEFLLTSSGEFHFLKISPWLGTSHPVTECVFGLDLVRLQLLVAEGGTLPFTAPPPMRGHAISVRLAAEDPAYDWRPSSGVIHRFTIPGVVHQFGPLLVPGIRLDPATTGCPPTTGRPPTTGCPPVTGRGRDPELATVTAWAPTRYEAARTLATALTHARVHGVTTNRDLLVRVLRHPVFLAGEIETGFLDRHPEVFAPLLSSLDAVRLAGLAAALASAAERRATAPGLASLPACWRNVPSQPQTVTYAGPTGPLEVAYQFTRDGELAGWSVRGATHPGVAVVSVAPDRVELEVNSVRLVFDVHTVCGDPAVCYVDSSEGSVTLTELPRFPQQPTWQPDRHPPTEPDTVAALLGSGEACPS